MTALQLPSAEEMTQRLRTWVERYRVAGATVAWMHGGEVQSAAAGVVNRQTGVETTTDSVFQIGSITKVYTTTLIMQLVDEGLIDLDAPAVTYLPDLQFGDPVQTPKVTIRHLLTHSSGVDGDYFDDFGRGDDAVEKYVAACKKLPFIFPLGEMWSYCNAGFVVLGRIIETMAGMTWERSLHDRLLAPIGAAHTVTLPEEALLHRTAAGHFGLAPDAPALSPVWGMPRAQAPAGSTPCSTVEDLLRFAALHLSGGKNSSGEQVLSASSVAEMQRTQVDLPPQPGEGAAHWGLGWMQFDWAGRGERVRVIGHDGGTVGQNSSLRILPDENLAVAVLTNTSPTGGVMAARIMRWLFGLCDIEVPRRPEPAPTPPDLDLTPYVGVYEKVEMRSEVTLVDGRLWLEFTGTGPLATIGPSQPPMPLFPVDETLMLQKVAENFYAPMTFSHFESGRPLYFFSGRVYRRV
jgi:CubicO group peptidase (beta-lactamase class C family)